MSTAIDDNDNDTGYTVETTAALATAIRDALRETDTCEDVWDTIDVNEPNNPESMVIITVEDGDLTYTLQLLPAPPEPAA